MWDPGHWGLGVCLLGVSLLNTMPRQQTKYAHCAPSLHRRRGAGEILKHSDLPILVMHVVALKYNAAFELTERVTLREFVFLFHCVTKDSPEVSCFMLILWLASVSFVTLTLEFVYQTISRCD